MKIGYIIASNHVAKERKLIGYLYREQPDSDQDSGWRVFSGDEDQDYADNPKNFAMYNAETIIEIDPLLLTVLDRDYPVELTRNFTNNSFEIIVD